MNIFRLEKEELRGSDIEATPLQNTMVPAPDNVDSASCAPSEAPPSYEEAVTRVSKPAISGGEEGQPPPYSL